MADFGIVNEGVDIHLVAIHLIDAPLCIEIHNVTVQYAILYKYVITVCGNICHNMVHKK